MTAQAYAQRALLDSTEPVTLHALLRAQVRQRPNATAVVRGSDAFTFAEIEALAAVFARALRASGVRHGDLVAVALERTPESIAALYAISMIGAAFVPLDPLAPENRLRLVIDDAAPSCVIGAARYRPALTAVADHVITLEDLLANAHMAAVLAPSVDDVVGPDDLAYVIYTSGSTGTPKGVMIEHGAATNTLRAVRAVFDYSPEDRIYQLAPWTFDPFVLQVFGTIGAGACVVLNATGAEIDFSAIADELVAQRITVFDTAPALLAPLLDQAQLARSSLRLIGCGGAVVVGALRDRCFTQLGVPLQNHYGPTETSILATTYRTRPTDTDARVPIGFPLPGVSVYVLDAERRPVAPGAEGELYIGGAGVGRGYVDAPELTALRFVADPFASEPGARMYRSGDLVRERADGAVEFIGRADSQVKVRGVRVELEEVESVLALHPRVDAVAALVEGDEGNERLLAVVAAKGMHDGLAAELTRHAAEHLPPAIRPARIYVTGSMPMLPSGKVDRIALRPFVRNVGDVAVIGDTLNDAIARIWRDVLGHGDFEIDSDFFAVGGNSLAAARCAARIAEHFGRRLPVAVLFARATIAHMAAELRSEERTALAPIVQIAGGTKTPLFFLHGDFTGVGLYARRFAGLLDEDRPIYALPPHGADGGPVPATIAAMAADQMREIRGVQPHGPYIIGGYCIGAIVALEIARLLSDEGETVSRVITIDAHHITPRTRTQAALAPLRRIKGIVHRINRWRAPTSAAAVAFDAATAHVEPAQDRAIRHHLWRRLSVPVTFLCSEDAIDDATIRRRWSSMLRELEIRRIRGDHKTALTLHVRETCRTIADVLSEIPVR